MPQRSLFSQWFTPMMVSATLILSGCITINSSAPPTAETEPEEASAVTTTGTDIATETTPEVASSPQPTSDATADSPSTATQASTTQSLALGDSRLLTPAEIGWVERNLPVPARYINVDQSFWVNLRDFGEVAFVVTDGTTDPNVALNDLAIYIVSPDGILIEQLPPNPDATWMLSETQAVSFQLLNGYDYVIVMADYITGVGQTAAVPFPVTTVYNNQGGYFTVDGPASLALTDRGVSTIAEANSILQNEFGYVP